MRRLFERIGFGPRPEEEPREETANERFMREQAERIESGPERGDQNTARRIEYAQPSTSTNDTGDTTDKIPSDTTETEITE